MVLMLGQADGGIGPNTLAKLDEYMQTNDIQTVIKKYQDVRLDYYKQLKTFETFGRGWTRRVEETTQMAMKLI